MQDMMDANGNLAECASVAPWRSKSLLKMQSKTCHDTGARQYWSNSTKENDTLSETQASAGICGQQTTMESLRTRSDPMDPSISSDSGIMDREEDTGCAQLNRQTRASLDSGELGTIGAQQDLFILQAEEHRAHASNAALNPGSEAEHLTNIYITDLPRDAGDDTLFSLGSACGTVISHKAMLDSNTGACKGFGFLMYATHDEAQYAIQWLGAHGFSSSFAKESFSAMLRRMEDSTSTNVYLSNLPLRYNERQLEQLFAPHPIASLKILHDNNGESRGVGFVRLMDRASAQRCIQRLHGRILPGTTQSLQVRFADSEAQKILKKSAHQRQTLESLGLFRDDRATDDVFRRQYAPVQSTNAHPDFATISQSAFNNSLGGDNQLIAWNHVSPGLPVNANPVSKKAFFDDRGLARTNFSNHYDYHAWPFLQGGAPLYTYNRPSFHDLENAVEPQMESFRQSNLSALKPGGMYPMDLRPSALARMYNSQMHRDPTWISTMPAYPNSLGRSSTGHRGMWKSTDCEPHSHRWDTDQDRAKAQTQAFFKAQDLQREREHHMRHPRNSATSHYPKSYLGTPSPQYRETNASLRAVSDPLAAKMSRNNVFRDFAKDPVHRRGAVSADNSIDEGHDSFREAYNDDLDYGSSSIDFQM